MGSCCAKKCGLCPHIASESEPGPELSLRPLLSVLSLVSKMVTEEGVDFLLEKETPVNAH